MPSDDNHSDQQGSGVAPKSDGGDGDYTSRASKFARVRGLPRGCGEDHRGHGDANRERATPPTATLSNADDTEILWQPDNGMQPDWLQDLADATGKPSFDSTNYRPVDYLMHTFPVEFISK